MGGVGREEVILVGERSNRADDGQMDDGSSDGDQ